ncbi:MAG: DMT family transporter [Spirochaetales bacterium]|nr:DMT family transporter [Spirochaetales bacterium]MCF7938129.1 DMT family transporter [Spirochaetales bacterium]
MTGSRDESPQSSGTGQAGKPEILRPVTQLSLRGILLVGLSALFFAAATVFAKLATSGTPVRAMDVVFTRFLFGAVLASGMLVVQKKKPRSIRFDWVLLRSLTNLGAVLLFFSGIERTTITNANLLNMTYPIFVFLISPFLNKERSPWYYVIYLAAALAGARLVIGGGFIAGGTDPAAGAAAAGLNLGDVLAFLSAVVAGVAIAALRQSRKYDDSFVILFYQMIIGTVILGAVALPGMEIPGGRFLFLVAVSGLLGTLGQVALTIGYRFIGATGGALVSSSRIIFAMVMGVLIFSDAFTWQVAGGSVLILFALVGVSGVFSKRES